MKQTELFAPEIDNIAEGLSLEETQIPVNIYLKLKEIYEVFSYVKPEGDDDVRHTWLECRRGPISAFGEFQEFKESGEVESWEEFEQLWKDYFPEKTKWYQFATAKYQNELFFYFNSNLIFRIQLDKKPETSNSGGFDRISKYVDWLLYRICMEVKKLEEDTLAYNKYIAENLSFSKRIGRIKRETYWDILKEDATRLDISLGAKNIQILQSVIEAMKKGSNTGLKEMTANRFFRLCEICYDTNNYFKNEKTVLNPKEKYSRMADTRHGGLKDIEGDSAEAFSKWYHSSEWLGSHPWEICRGGNSTHISLFVSESEGKWVIRLAGSSIVRVEETVRMAIALTENNVPFILSDAEEILRMIIGQDYIGIVPENITPRYCHSLFPSEERIIDFMNLGNEPEYTQKIIEQSYWYPIETIELA